MPKEAILGKDDKDGEILGVYPPLLLAQGFPNPSSQFVARKFEVYVQPILLPESHALYESLCKSLQAMGRI